MYGTERASAKLFTRAQVSCAAPCPRRCTGGHTSSRYVAIVGFWAVRACASHSLSVRCTAPMDRRELERRRTALYVIAFVCAFSGRRSLSVAVEPLEAFIQFNLAKDGYEKQAALLSALIEKKKECYFIVWFSVCSYLFFFFCRISLLSLNAVSPLTRSRRRHHSCQHAAPLDSLLPHPPSHPLRLLCDFSLLLSYVETFSNVF